MPTITNFVDSYGADLATVYLTKEYVMDNYPDLVPNILMPELKTWGANNTGQMGDGSTVSKSSPVIPSGGGTNWSKVGYGQTAVAIKSDGTLWNWGSNSFGALGNAESTLKNQSSPVTTGGGGTTWVQTASGDNHRSAVKSDGTLWSWGYNISGQLGNGATLSRSSPVQISGSGTTWAQVACGYRSSVAVKTDGTLWAWGSNTNGILGDGTSTSKSSPIQIGTGTTWSQVAGFHQNYAAIKTDGTLWGWGLNTLGQLGEGTTVTSRTSPVQISGGGTTWKKVVAGYDFAAAIKTDGTLWTWGLNTFGQLGDGSTVTSRTSPVSISGGGTNWRQVSCGHAHAAAIKTDGTLWTWGQNTTGELGLNSTTPVSTSSPAQTTVSTTNWKQVSACYDFNLAVSEVQGW